MNEPNSRGEVILLADDNGEITILEPLEDWDAHRTPEQRQALDNYLKRMRKLYRPGPTPPETPPSANTP